MLFDWKRHTYKKNADSEALDQFILGLDGSLEHQVRSKNPRTLQEALNEAILFEQKSSARKFEERYGAGTKAPPAWAEELLKHVRASGQTNPIVSSNFNAQNPAGVSNEAVIRLSPATEICNYCRATDHTAEKCRKKSFDSKFCLYCKINGHLLSECRCLQSDVKNGIVIRDTTQYQGNKRQVDNNSEPVNNGSASPPNNNSGYKSGYKPRPKSEQ